MQASRDRRDRTREAELELLEVFRTSATKREANARAKPILEQLSRDPSFLSAVIAKYLATPGALDKGNYPVVGMEIALNPWFGLVANCWIPLPGRETHVSTKAIHHHGTMLLSTVTLFGPGYEHWMFTMPKPVSDGADLHTMELLEAAPHPKHHVSFVDSWIAHTPLYPSSLSITLALWSNSLPTTWRDRVKRMKPFRGREEQLRNLAVKMGLRDKLDLKVIESHDFFPAKQGSGFTVMRQREEFGLGPNEDHLCSVLHIVQETGNERLGRDVRRAIDDGKVGRARGSLEKLLADLDAGRPIEGRLSPGHYGVPHANFTRDDIRRALGATDAGAHAEAGANGTDGATKGTSHGGKLPPSQGGEAPLGTGPR